MFFLFPRLEHPAGWICARYKSLLLLLFFEGKDFLVLYKTKEYYKITLMFLKKKICDGGTMFILY